MTNAAIDGSGVYGDDLRALCGRVVRGHRRGHGLGFPTANLDCDVPQNMRHGLYAAWVHAGDQIHRAVLCIGAGGTFDLSGPPCAEVHLLDERCHLYERELEVRPVGYLGPMPTAPDDLTLSHELRQARDEVRRRLPAPIDPVR